MIIFLFDVKFPTRAGHGEKPFMRAKTASPISSCCSLLWNTSSAFWNAVSMKSFSDGDFDVRLDF